MSRKTHMFVTAGCFAMLLLNACSSQLTQINKNENTLSEYAPKVALPAQNISLPAKGFGFCLPTGQLKPAPERIQQTELAQTFSSRELNQVAISDPTIFQDNNKLTIDLSAIEEVAFSFPLLNAKVISPYGGRRHHTGVDLKTCPKDTILAAFDGVVRMAKPYAGYGNIVLVRHANGLETLYSHNSKNLVSPGDVVKAGQPIALTGQTGRATTAHLHFETRINGRPINPDNVFNLKERSLRQQRLVCTKTSGGGIAVKPIS